MEILHLDRNESELTTYVFTNDLCDEDLGISINEFGCNIANYEIYR